MRHFFGGCPWHPQTADLVGIAQSRPSIFPCSIIARLIVLTTALGTPTICHAESQTSTTGASVSLDFRIVIPAVVIVSVISQPVNIVIESGHIAQGYIDLDASTLVKITSNSRNGYLLTARYDAQFLTKIEVRILGQNLTAASGIGSMYVSAGIATAKLVPISYRLHLAPGVHVGDYPWPVALAFSRASV